MSYLFQLPKISDPRGNLSFLESGQHIPFDIVRAYWIYDVPGGEERGGHAFYQQNEFIICLSGSVKVSLHNGEKIQEYTLTRSYYGVHVPKMTWRSLTDFSTNAIVLIVCDREFDANDYIRDFDTYIALANEQSKK